MIDLTLPQYLRISRQQNTQLILKTFRQSNILNYGITDYTNLRNMNKDRTPVVDTKRFRNQTFVLFLFIIHHIYIYIFTERSRSTSQYPSTSIGQQRDFEIENRALFEPGKYKEQTIPTAPLSIDRSPLRAPLELNRIGHEEILSRFPCLPFPYNEKINTAPPPLLLLAQVSRSRSG